MEWLEESGITSSSLVEDYSPDYLRDNDFELIFLLDTNSIIKIDNLKESGGHIFGETIIYIIEDTIFGKIVCTSESINIDLPINDKLIFLKSSKNYAEFLKNKFEEFLKSDKFILSSSDKISKGRSKESSSHSYF